LIGYVDDVHTEETGLYQYADIIPNAVIDLLDVVFISTGNDDSGDAE
jgi:cell shape-determining protein MreC